MIQAELFQATDITDVSSSSIPGAAESSLLSGAALLLRTPPQSLTEFARLTRLSSSDGYSTFFGQHLGVHADGLEEQRLEVVDIDENDQYVGSGQICLVTQPETPFFQNKPFVSHNHTTYKLREDGLGKRRVLAMNAASLAHFRLSLYSDTTWTHIAAQKIWQRLEREGQVASYNEDKGVRYHFLQTD